MRFKPMIILVSIVLSLFLLTPFREGISSIGSLRVIVGLIVGLFLPGYLLLLISPLRHKKISASETFALSIVFSISLLGIVGYILNSTALGINENSVLLSTSLIIFLEGGVALYMMWRESRSPQSFESGVNESEELWKIVDKAALGILLVLLVLTGYSMLLAITSPTIGDRFTEVYILNERKVPRDYPHDIFLGENNTIWFGIVNREGKEMTYHVEVWVTKLTFNENGGLNETEAAYLIKQIDLTLPPANPQLYGNWKSQWERRIVFSINQTGEWQLWILVFKKSPPPLPRTSGNLATLAEVKFRFKNLMSESVIWCKLDLKVRRI